MATSKVIKTPTGKSKSGSYGSYFVLDAEQKIGVKVLSDCCTRKSVANQYTKFLDYFTDEDGLYGMFAEAAKELAAIQMLEGSGQTPKPYGLCWVRGKSGRFNIGIMMEHIEGLTQHGYEHKFGSKQRIPSVWRMEANHRSEWSRKFGIDVNDWHEWNVIVDSNRKQYRIDFTPEYFTVRRRDEFQARVLNEVVDLMENFPN